MTQGGIPHPRSAQSNRWQSLIAIVVVTLANIGFIVAVMRNPPHTWMSSEHHLVNDTTSATPSNALKLSHPDMTPASPNLTLITITTTHPPFNSSLQLPFPILENTTLTHLGLTVSSAGCPPMKTALIGILSIPKLANTARRNYLRQIYSNLNSKLPHDQQIDFIYVFGRALNPESETQLLLEKSMFPHDIIITHRKEGRDDGMIFDWFQEARKMAFSPHPTRHGEWCQMYRYFGKSDDDAVVHIERLSRLLATFPQGQPNFVGKHALKDHLDMTHMTGMMYLLTADILEWIFHSPIPRENLKGMEDVQVGKWLVLGAIEASWIDVGTKFHNLPEADYFQKPVTNETAVVHWCKSETQFFKCVNGLNLDLM
ncbi:hypothetical protein HDU77_003088 [Chytriomyces hyalinus]|nr:hypothetical protein HDU77_003088 [Chytriomyces hyalinus]